MSDIHAAFFSKSGLFCAATLGLDTEAIESKCKLLVECLVLFGMHEYIYINLCYDIIRKGRG